MCGLERSMNDKVREMMSVIGAWIDAERSGLEYDHATSFCHNCPHRETDESTYEEIMRLANVCCKEMEDYQAQEWATIQAAENALKALAELSKALNGEKDE
jgi:hypothetical protein